MASPGLVDTPPLKGYQPKNYPVIPNADPRYFNDEHRKISEALAAIITACKELEARLVAGGL